MLPAEIWDLILSYLRQPWAYRAVCQLWDRLIRAQGKYLLTCSEEWWPKMNPRGVTIYNTPEGEVYRVEVLCIAGFVQEPLWKSFLHLRKLVMTYYDSRIKWLPLLEKADFGSAYVCGPELATLPYLRTLGAGEIEQVTSMAHLRHLKYSAGGRGIGLWALTRLEKLTMRGHKRINLMTLTTLRELVLPTLQYESLGLPPSVTRITYLTLSDCPYFLYKYIPLFCFRDRRKKVLASHFQDFLVREIICHTLVIDVQPYFFCHLRHLTCERIEWENFVEWRQGAEARRLGL